MTSNLKISLIQLPLFWENALKNRAYIEKHLNSLDKNSNIVLLPEMFNSGFTMNARKVSETMTGPSILWMKSWAEKLNTILGGSLAIKEGENFYNRFVIVSSEGVIARYDKRHTFTLAEENKSYTSGNDLGLFKYQGWKICLRICYDLRFPVWSRNTTDYDLLIFVANWPVDRISAWDTLLRARAIENMCYVVGVNRTGKDFNGLNYPGHSSIYDPMGELITPENFIKEGVVEAILDYSELEGCRKQFRFLEDRDNFDLC